MKDQKSLEEREPVNEGHFTTRATLDGDTNQAILVKAENHSTLGQILNEKS